MKCYSVILLFLLCACTKKQPVVTGLEGSHLPEFKMLLSDSVSVFSSNKLEAKRPVVLFFFSSYCPYCRAELRTAIANIEKIENIDIIVITNQPPSVVRQVYDKYELKNYSNIVIGTNGKLMDYFKLTQVPYLAVYNADKKLKGCFVGTTTMRDIVGLANN